MGSQSWKHMERVVAKDFGGKRHIRINYAEKNEDIDGVEEFVIECKHRKTLDKVEAVTQAEDYNRMKYDGKKIPIAITQVSGMKKKCISLRLKSLRALSQMGFPMNVVVDVNYEDFVKWYRKFKKFDKENNNG